MRELIGDCGIEDLPVSFTAVATDLESGEEVWLREGKLFDAIRASMATPLIFTPFEYGGRHLLDGGLVNPVPVAPTLSDKTDLTVAVSLCGRIEERLPAPPAVPNADGNAYRQRIRVFVSTFPLVKKFRSASHTALLIRPRVRTRFGVRVAGCVPTRTFSANSHGF